MLGNEQTKVNDTLIYRDFFVSCFFDEEKLLSIYVNDKGTAKTLSIDSNFYSIEDDIIAYERLLFDSLQVNGKIEENNLEDYKKLLKAFVDDITKDYDDELNYEYLEHNGVKL